MSTKLFEQLTTFYVAGELFGIDVMKVQEVTGKLSLVPVPLSSQYIRGIINLRGQITTAVGLRELFNYEPGPLETMSVVCKHEGNLLSLIVDSIGDVVGVDVDEFEVTPSSIPLNVRRFLKGIYKLNGEFLSVIDLEAFTHEFIENRNN